MTQSLAISKTMLTMAAMQQRLGVISSQDQLHFTTPQVMVPQVTTPQANSANHASTLSYSQCS